MVNTRNFSQANGRQARIVTFRCYSSVIASLHQIKITKKTIENNVNQ